MFGERGARSRNSLMEEQSILMHEAQRHELGEATSLLLDFAEQQKLIDPVFGGLDVSIHQRGGAADAAGVRGTDDLLPLLGGKFVARKYKTDVVVDDLGGRARQSVEAVVTEHASVIFKGHGGELDA